MNKLILIVAMVFCVGNISAQSGEWTWVHGPQLGSNPNGNYGVKGVAALSNVPPARYQAAYWKDLDGNFWVFGGVNFNNSVMTIYNDLWKFDITIKQWTWVHGPQAASNVSGQYGTMGISSPLNIPPARSWGANCWTGIDGKLYLFGGFGSQDFNDLWQYDIPSNEWTWIGGSALGGVLPSYGTKGVAAASNNPGSRAECKSGWTINNQLWLFGGQSLVQTMNDLWKFDLNTNLWTWESGENAPPI